MPPKQKYTKEEIIAAALNLVRTEGLAGLTARGLGAVLGTSARPIFTAFKDMEEVQKETISAAKTLYNSYTDKAFTANPPFREVGMQYFRFAREEPRLFEVLFMRSSESKMEIADFLSLSIDNYEKILDSIEESYGLPRQFARHSFEDMWLFTHGIACLQATDTIQFTDEKVGALLDQMYNSLYLLYKAGEEPQI